jgi:hypothetical protein
MRMRSLEVKPDARLQQMTGVVALPIARALAATAGHFAFSGHPAFRSATE